MNVGHFNEYPRYNLIDIEKTTFDYINRSDHASTTVLCKSQDLTDSNKELLSKILKAVGETLESVNIYFHQQRYTFLC